jgi:putative ABC transport system substrate-binding protein
MKKQMMKRIGVGMSMLMVVGLLAGCVKAEATGDAAVKPIEIGITQIVEHPSLDEIRQGIIDQLEVEGYRDGQEIHIDFQNAQGAIENTQMIAQEFQSQKKDVIVAITTPSAQAMKNVIEGIPVVFSAVTDPEGAGLIGPGMTGVSNLTPIESQFDLFKTLLPEVKTIGMVYNTAEANSVFLMERAKKKAEELGYKMEVAVITSTNEVGLALDQLLPKVDMLYSVQDNMVASAFPVVVQKANEAGVPIIGTVQAFVDQGAVAMDNASDYEVGLQTGKMLARILEGANVDDLPFETTQNTAFTVNEEALAFFGITLPEELEGRLGE